MIKDIFLGCDLAWMHNMLSVFIFIRFLINTKFWTVGSQEIFSSIIDFCF